MAHYEYQGKHYELPDGISNDEALSKIKQHLGQATGKDDVLGTNASYEKYKQDYQEKQTQPLIPGWSRPAGPPLSQEEFKSQRDKDLLKGIAAPFDAGLSFALKLPAMMAAGPAAIYAAMRGGDPEKTLATVMQGPEWTDPKTDEGAAVLNKFGEAMQPFGLAPYASVGPMITRGSIGKVRAKGLKEKLTPPQTPKPTIADIVAAEKTPEITTPAKSTEVIDPEYKRLTPGIHSGPDSDAAQIKLLEDAVRQGDAQKAINDRQAALEFDVKKQATIDFNRAERERQANAPTGYEAWKERQRQLAESRQPSDNTPLDFTVEKPPFGLADEPYRYEGGIDPNIVNEKALPIEVADMLRTGEVAPDPFNRYSPQQMANRILREGEHPPIIKTDQYSGRGAAPRGALFPNRRPQDKHTLPGADMLKLAVKLLPAKVSPSSEKTMEVANIVGLKDTPYSRVNTVQQVMENPGPDLSPLLRSTKDYMQSGLEGTLRHNPKNQAVNFARNKMQEARNFAERLSKQYLTNDKTGLNAQLNKLSTKEKTDVVGLMLELDRQEVPLSDRIMEKAGFTENQKAVARAMREADDVLYAERNRVLGELGYDATPYREGHMPGNFGGAYRTLIGYTDKDGNFHITGIAQADTKLGHTKALEYYRNLPEDPGKKRVEVPLGRTGPGQRIRSSPYDAWADLVQEVAKHDPKFAETLRIAEQKTKDTIASMYNFHVHEKAKKGIVGSYGNRPWLSAEQNAKEFLKGFIDYLEEGYRYTSYQQPLNEIAQLTMNPEFRASHPNTVKYLERYVRHVTGSNLNPIGAAGNWAIDQALKAVGLGNNQFNKVSRELTQASTLHMMGVFNPGFFLAQLTQWATGGIPEAAQIRATLKQDPQLMVNSLQRAILDITALNIEENTGKVVRDVPQHMKDAYKWGHDNGLFTFSEVALAHEVLQSKLRRKVTPYLDWPIRLGEQATRPTVFLTFADMFHNAGFRGKEVMLRAQAATDWAMVNYHPDERPMIYQSLGALGNSLGALSTYKHNLVSQYGQRAVQAGKYPMAAAAMLGMGYALYGVSGLPGYQEATDMAERITDKPLREMILSDPKQSSTFMDGVLSAKTGVDFQSRLSMSNVLPDSPMSAFPHISNFVNIMDKAYEAGMNWDQGSASEFAKALAPAGIKPSVEHMTAPKDKEGNVYPTTKEGMNKYSTPRSTKEQVVRDILGVRPLRERLEDERIWSTRKSEAKRQDKLKDALMRFDRAYLNGDTDGMAKAEDDYTKNDGDITTLYNSSRLRSVTEKSVQDEATRRAGKPTKNLNTLKRYEEFTQ